MACGHDGFLQGRPEPVILLAAYSLQNDVVTCLGRELCRFRVLQPFPCQVDLVSPAELKAKISRQRAGRVLVLGVGLEEDSGEDVQTIFGLLERAGRDLFLWDPDETLPEPVTLAEMALGEVSVAPKSTPVNLLRDGTDLRDICQSDTLVGACTVVLNTRTGVNDIWRMPFVSDDKLNDWTAQVLLRW